MNEFIFCFIRIVWIGALIIAVMLLALGLILLFSPALLLTAFRIGGALICLSASLLLLIRLFL